MASFDALPEECLARIISLTTPGDACRLSAVSRAFRSASDSDDVWLRFLPSDLERRVTGSAPSRPLGPSVSRKKDVFFGLCSSPVLIDNGHKSIALEKESGKKCLMMGARALTVVWGDTPQCWKWSSQHISRFPEVAELLSVCWFEVHAEIEMQLLSAKTHYSAYFVFKFVEGNCGFENQHVEVSIFPGSGGGHRCVYLDPDGKLRQRIEISRVRNRHLLHLVVQSNSGWDRRIPRDRGDGWEEVSLGEFSVEDPAAGEVLIKLMELKSGNRKSGLVIQGIELRPMVH